MTVTGTDSTTITITVALNKVVINAIPFRVDLYNNNVLSVSLNAKGLMRFEHLRSKSDAYVYDICVFFIFILREFIYFFGSEMLKAAPLRYD